MKMISDTVSSTSKRIEEKRSMSKYARIVFEIEIEEDATDKEILDTLEAHLGEFINNPWSIDDIEIHDTPYIQDE